ncbi:MULTISPECIES: anthrax toxin lethal factor-related metalloendopeptidase [Bacillota]|uniref:ATLF-like domain-containing protein n=2 Tax=Bacillota TaxID=1239 RepID=A0A9X4B767_ENTFC|nr:MULTISPECIES: hypothetical protein [Bacillota]MDC4242489.1 hypothetical protein [Clostridium tertium]MDC4246169.1 hypothetical protein [Clostridium perfringens]MDC4249122.1 hypothetical protein [Enterococcus faecium]
MPHEFDKIKDFKLDKPKADEWARLRYEKWEKSSNPSDFETVKEFIRESNNFKKILKEYNGILDDIDDSKYPNVKKKLKELNKLLNYEVNRLIYPKDIYIGLDANDLGVELRAQYMNNTPTTLNIKACSNILNYKFGTLLGFEVGSLIKDIREMDKVLLRITLPAGSYLGCFYSRGEQKAIIPPNNDIEIKSSKIIAYEGREIIALKAVLKEKYFVDKKISNLEKKLSNKFVDFDKSIYFVKLDFKKGFESYALEFAETSINSLISNFPKNKQLYEDTIDDIKQIVFTDGRIPVPTGSDISGWFDQYNKILYIKPTTPRFVLNIDKSMDSKTTILHEVAHAVDQLHLDFSMNAKFNQIYNEEKAAVIQNETITSEGYAGNNISEYFAEVFKAIYSPYSEQRQAIQEIAPKSVSFIEQKIKEYK